MLSKCTIARVSCFYRTRPDFDKELSSNRTLHQMSPNVEVAHSRSSSSASSASHQSADVTPLRGGTLPRAKPKKVYGDITPTRKLSRQTTSDVDAHTRTEASPHLHQAIRKYLSDDAARQATLPRKVKVTATRSEGRRERTSRPSSANSTTSADDHFLAEEHDNMIFEVKTLTQSLLDLQNLVRIHWKYFPLY